MLGAGTGALVFWALAWPHPWLHGAYTYPYHAPYSFHNDTSNKDESLPVICGCDPERPCGCDDSNPNASLDSLVNRGKINSTNAVVGTKDGVRTLFINGTLEGDVNDDDSAASTVAIMGFWPLAAIVAASVYLV